MKIAFFTYTRLEYGGGVAKYYIETASGLAKRYKNLKIDIISFEKKTLRKFLLLYFLYFFGKQDMDQKDKENIISIKKKLGFAGYYQYNFKSLLKKLKGYDLIYTTNNLLEVMLFKYLIGYRHIPPIVYGFHIPMYYEFTSSLQSKIHNLLYRSPLYIKALKGAKVLHVMNTFDEDIIKDKFNIHNVKKIYYAFNFDQFAKVVFEYKPPYKWNKLRTNILWTGRLTEQKGIDKLFEIIEGVNAGKCGKKIIWNIFGDGELKDRVRAFSLKHKNVSFFGYVENRFMADIMNKCDFFISTSNWESFPYNILEAQAFGLPVVCFDISGCNDIVKDGVNGYLVTDTAEFKKRINDIVIKNNFKKEKIRNYIVSRFNFEDLFSEMYRLFTE